MAATQERRNLAKYAKLSAMLAESPMDSLDMLDKPPRLIGAGSYNDVFVVRFQGHVMVMRLSYYSAYTLGRVQSIIRQHLPYDELINKSHRITALDPVTVKNNYSRFCNHLIDQNVCPHFVYMFGFRDVKCFASYVKDQVKPDRMRNNLAFRYNNVSFHEKFHTSLRLRLRQLSDLQLRVALFQVLYALAVLQHYVPSFRHNDLSLDNILITLTPTPGQEQQAHTFTSYKLPLGQEFWVPNVGVFTAVADFDLAHAPAIATLPHNQRIGLQNQLITKEQFAGHTDEQARNINGSHNPSFDSYYFLYRLKEALNGRKGQKQQPQQQPGGVAAWLEKQTNIGGKVKYLGTTIPLLTPSLLLGNTALFGMFKRPPPHGAKVAASYAVAKLDTLSIQTSKQPPAARAAAAAEAAAADAVLPPRASMKNVVIGGNKRRARGGGGAIRGEQ